jgi:hypothetical protein
MSTRNRRLLNSNKQVYMGFDAKEWYKYLSRFEDKYVRVCIFREKTKTVRLSGLSKHLSSYSGRDVQENK